jgi:hypothetical protein
MPLLHPQLEPVKGFVRNRSPDHNPSPSPDEYRALGNAVRASTRGNRLKQAPGDLANEPRGPRRDVKPDGKQGNSTSSAASERSGGSVRSSRVDGNENSCCQLPYDSPRVLPVGPKSTPSDAGDVDRTARAGRLSRLRWRDNADSPSASPTGALPYDKRGYSNERKHDAE